MTSNVVYSNGMYRVLRTTYPKNRPYKVISRDYKVHTHLRNKKEAVDLCNFAKHKEIPYGASTDYLISLSRIAKDKKYKAKIDKLISRKERS